MSSINSLDRLTDQALLDQFGDLVQQGHHHTIALLRHIDAIDRRKLWAKYGHPSLFDFCVGRHHMSESTAAKRIGAARAAWRFPILLEMIGRGEIHLSGIHRLKAHLTEENQERVLAQAKHKTIRQIDQLVARLAPKPDVPSTIKALPTRREAALLPVTRPPRVESGPSTPATLPTTAPVQPQPSQMPLAPAAERRASDPVPLSPGRYKLTVTLDEGSHQKLKQLQDLLAHKIPNSDPAAIIERALDTLLTEVRKSKHAVTERPRVRKPDANPPRRTRPVPAALRREVLKRDGGSCSFVGADGHRCGETRALEYAHLNPWAKGGGHSLSNLALRCRAHNAFEAERDYGTGFMARKRNQPLKVREPLAKYATRVPEVQAPGRAQRSGGSAVSAATNGFSSIPSACVR